jgi:predicted RNA-binding Zn-ribbon protein involved in translation (DUF1610 family)
MNIKNSTVYIICVSTAVRIAQATNCKFYFGPVTGSVFIDKCDHCVFHVASRQVRISDNIPMVFAIFVNTEQNYVFSDSNPHYAGMRLLFERTKQTYHRTL